ncbi:hypothetical protein OXT66_07460 [Lentilactobacillus senioris]|uniref:hypothetical protein n=1 Tax=Lentilactobacillus senioris TaxID=931534 RepID=UPI0022815AAE|nr:hypothetical protein [Lentilactobacillus senioris]MCY9807369.1 hypothetical protein [Lentilactobacillus senioris]
MKKIIRFSLALFMALLVLGTGAKGTSAKSFTYANNKHKTYQSVQTYKINKTYKTPHSGYLKLKKIYVYHVSKAKSKYQTWVKVDLSIKNTNDKYLIDIDKYGGSKLPIYHFTKGKAKKANFKYSDSFQTFPSSVAGGGGRTRTYDHSRWEVSKAKTGKLGKTNLRLNLWISDWFSPEIKWHKDISVNLK